MTAPAYRCPLCRQSLQLDARSWACPSGHRFDIAREGYVNLLPVHKKKSLAPGDSEAMLKARRAFLAQGHYAPLRAALAQALPAGREVVSIVPSADIGKVAKGKPPAPGATRIERLRGDDYVRVWINRGGNHYLIHLSAA